MAERAKIEVQVGVAAESDAAELADMTARLRRELMRLDVEAVDQLRAGEPPPGTKGAELVVVGTLMVSLARSVGALGAVVRAVQGWLSGQRGRTVKLQMDDDAIELTGVSSRQQQRLIDVWIKRHAERS
jgi:hypothetical protein